MNDGKTHYVGDNCPGGHRGKSYTQTFASLAPQFKPQDDGITFTITVQATTRVQATRRLRTLLYGRSAVAITTLHVVPGSSGN